MWFFERVINPKEIDAVLDARVRGGIAHQTLYRFYSGLPKRLGTDAVEADRLDEALVFLRECLAEAIAGGVRMELSDLERLELEETLEAKIRRLETEGLLRPALKRGPMPTPSWKPIRIRGKSMSQTISEERDER